jgi:hypothetical protein
MTYTYKQVLAYEVASELANTHIADYSAAIGEEEENACPDHARIDQLREACPNQRLGTPEPVHDRRRGRCSVHCQVPAGAVT